MLAHTCYLTDARIRREAEALAGNGVEVHVVSLMEEIRGAGSPAKLFTTAFTSTASTSAGSGGTS